MRAAWAYSYNLIDRIVPNGLSLYMLGAGLAAAGLAHVLITLGFLDILDILLVIALLLAGLGNTALAAVAATNALRRSSALAMRQPIGAFRFIHIAVAAHAALVLALLLSTLRALLENIEGVFIGILMPLIWTPLAGAALVLAMLNGLRWDARFAALGAGVSLAVFGCAVGYTPTIYGWDLRPLGWWMILASFIPVLAFLAMFLRRYSRVFSENRWRVRAAALALLIALACALALKMALTPADRFEGNLQAAFDGNQGEIRFSDMADFDWDTVEIHNPSSQDFSPDIMEKVDIVTLSYFRGMDVPFDFIVFRKEGGIVHLETIWRRHSHRFQLPPGVDPMILRREDAVFMVEYTTGGYRRLRLKD